MQAQLNISIDQSGLQQIAAAGQSISLAYRSRGLAGPAIRWLAIAKAGVNNVVLWNPTRFMVYVTDTVPSPDETIVLRNWLLAELGWTYTFDGGGIFGEFVLPSDFVKIVNRGGPGFFFGLAYEANMNGESIRAPISVASLRSLSGTFAPGDEINVFLSHGNNSGTVTPVPGNALTLKVTANATVVFDSKTNTFRIA